MSTTLKLCKYHGECNHYSVKGTDRFRCTKCSTESIQRRRVKLKEMAVEYKGGKCEHCGYNKYFGALEFHHIDPSQKDFSIGDSHTRSFERMKVELDKCIMLCSNCHKEEHYRLSC